MRLRVIADSHSYAVCRCTKKWSLLGYRSTAWPKQHQYRLGDHFADFIDAQVELAATITGQRRRRAGCGYSMSTMAKVKALQVALIAASSPAEPRRSMAKHFLKRMHESMAPDRQYRLSPLA